MADTQIQSHHLLSFPLVTTLVVFYSLLHSLLSILFQSLEPLKQSIPKSFSVTWTQVVEKRVNSLVILCAKVFLHLVEGVANHLQNRVIFMLELKSELCNLVHKQGKTARGQHCITLW